MRDSRENQNMHNNIRDLWYLMHTLCTDVFAGMRDEEERFFSVSLFSVPFPWCMYVCTTAAADDDDIIAWILNVCQLRELFLRFRRFQALDCALLLCSAGVFISYCHLFTEWTFDADVKGYKQHNAIECFFNSLLYSISDSNCVKSQAWSLSLDLIAISFIFLGSWRRTDTNSKWNVWFKLKDRNLLLFFFIFFERRKKPPFDWIYRW